MNRAEDFGGAGVTQPAGVAARGAVGYIYLAVMPGNQFKIGFSTDIEKRLEKVIAWVPTVEIAHRWPARQNWETYVRDFATADVPGVRSVPLPSGTASEVFEICDKRWPHPPPAFVAETLETVRCRASRWIDLHAMTFPLDREATDTGSVVSIDR